MRANSYSASTTVWIGPQSRQGKIWTRPELIPSRHHIAETPRFICTIPSGLKYLDRRRAEGADQKVLVIRCEALVTVNPVWPLAIIFADTVVSPVVTATAVSCRTVLSFSQLAPVATAQTTGTAPNTAALLAKDDQSDRRIIRSVAPARPSSFIASS